MRKTLPATVRMAPTGVKSNIVKAAPVISSRTRDTTMLGEVPIWVIRPPSSDAKAIGIRKVEGETPDRRANWKAIGIMIASAPMFLTNADKHGDQNHQKSELGPDGIEVRSIALDRQLHDATARHPRADQQSTADDDDDVVAEPGKGFVKRDHPHRHGG